MSVPGVATMISDVLLNLIYIDILYTEKWFPQLLEYLRFDLNFQDKPINSYFNQNGFQSMLLIKNLGSTFFFILFYFLAWSLLLSFKLASIFIDWFDKVAKKLESVLIWNGTINFKMQQFTPMIMCSIINLYDVSDY